MILSKVNLPSEYRSPRRAGAAVLGVLLLGGCMPSPPPEDASGPPPAPAAPAVQRRPASFAALDLPLDPLANKDELLRSFQAGRRDPFANVIFPKTSVTPGSAEAEGGSSSAVTGSGLAGSGGTAAAGSSVQTPIMTPITLTGLIHGAGSSEAIVSYNGQSGTLRPGDKGGQSTDLLPKNWRVQSIDVNGGHLLLLDEKGRKLKQDL